MSDDLTLGAQLPARYQELVESGRGYLEQSLADSTRKAYRQGWERFELWCKETNQRAMPASASSVALFVTALADEGAAISTIRLYLTAVGRAHVLQGRDSPADDPRVKQLLKGVPRVRHKAGVSTRQTQARPLLVAELRAMCEAMPHDVRGLRDRAMLLMAFAGAMRRSEVVSIQLEDCEESDDGLRVLLRHTKTDAEGEGTLVGIPWGSAPSTCPVRSVRAWREHLGRQCGPLFPTISAHGAVWETAASDRAVQRALERAAAWGDVPTDGLTTHALRSGLATAAARAGKSDRSIMRQGRWAGRSMVDRYVREAQILDDANAAAGIGL